MSSPPGQTKHSRKQNLNLAGVSACDATHGCNMILRPSTETAFSLPGVAVTRDATSQLPSSAPPCRRTSQHRLTKSVPCRNSGVVATKAFIWLMGVAAAVVAVMAQMRSGMAGSDLCLGQRAHSCAMSDQPVCFANGCLGMAGHRVVLQQCCNSSCRLF